MLFLFSRQSEMHVLGVVIVLDWPIHTSRLSRGGKDFYFFVNMWLLAWIGVSKSTIQMSMSYQLYLHFLHV